MGKRIGILGGTFNPVHAGHLIIAQAVVEKYHLDSVLFVPCYQTPHTYKNPRGLVSAQHRLRMLRLAIAGNPVFKVSDIEIKKGGKSYSIDTLRMLRDQYPKGTKFYFIIGADVLSELATWRAIKQLRRSCHFITVARAGSKPYRQPRQYYLPQPLIGISSTTIRSRIKKARSIRYLVPLLVERYIIKHRLYR